MHINSSTQWPLADIINTKQYYVYRCIWMYIGVYRCIYVSACMHESEFWTPILCSAQHLLHLPLQHHNTYCTSLSNITTPMPRCLQAMVSRRRRRRRRRQAETETETETGGDGATNPADLAKIAKSLLFKPLKIQSRQICPTWLNHSFHWKLRKYEIVVFCMYVRVCVCVAKIENVM